MLNTRGHGVAREISQVFRQESVQIFRWRGKCLRGREAFLIYTSLGCGGVFGSVDRIAEHLGDRSMVKVCLRVCLPH